MKDPAISASVDGKVVLNEDQVMDLFVVNPFDANASYDGKLIDSVGQEYAFVKAQPEDRIATLIEGDNGSIHICNGWHCINLLGYFVGREALPDFGSLCVLEDGDEDEEEGEGDE